MGWIPIFFSIGLLGVGTAWYFYYVRDRVPRTGAIYHIFERLGRMRFEGLDSEWRGIMKETGLREQDPFDEVVARAYVLDAEEDDDYEAVALRAAKLLAERTQTSAEHLRDGFLRGTRVGATPVSHGAALPHLRLPGLVSPEMVMVRARQGVKLTVVDEFGEEVPQEQTIEAFFFLVSAEENPSQHLRILAQIAGRVDDDDFLQAWHTAANEQALKEILLRDERYLSLVVEPGHALGAFIGKALYEIDFPEGGLVALVHRGELTFVPSGRSVLHEGDRLTVIGATEAISELRARETPEPTVQK
jgi:mannitol/fructose-specific phosphotransferase system IIA component (Ntr-type)